MAFNPTSLLIVGAGFSANAGLPVTQDLLNLRGLKLDGPSAAGRVYPKVRGPSLRRGREPQRGRLGTRYSAADLRVVRRAIIVRMIRMLSQAYSHGQKRGGADWTALEKLFTKFDATATAAHIDHPLGDQRIASIKDAASA